MTDSKRSAAMRAYWARRRALEIHEDPVPVHAHELEDGGDYCSGCGALLCPDTGKPVAYDGARYWHKDGTACFVHQWINEEDAEAWELAGTLRSLADGQEDEMGGLFSAAAAKLLELAILADFADEVAK